MTSGGGKYQGMRAQSPNVVTMDNSRRFFLSADALDCPTSSPSEPNVEHCVKCVCFQIRTLLEHSVKHPKQNPTVIPLFCEDLNALDVRDIRQLTVPDLNHMQVFMLYIIDRLHMNPQCAIICLIYIERLITDASIVLHPINWRRVVVITLLMASKVWEDHAVQNVSVVKRAFPFFTVQDVNAMEKTFLELVDYNVTVTAKEYLEYYFSLRELDGAEFLTQMRKEELDMLESKTKQNAQNLKNRFKSFDDKAT
ncbi:putative CCNYL1 protein [Blattamonas nauphoetae]|uniref:CCNYL1 protein n=1 Tax=Blattamonas nauphoetae TaxID=2049346 RepID=A0ABQ9YKT8_9EUKA|nr:putative CCNYL1 protein [Blattamonas nauphoetae]